MKAITRKIAKILKFHNIATQILPMKRNMAFFTICTNCPNVRNHDESALVRLRYKFKNQ